MQAKELWSHQRSKHVLRRYHVIRKIIIRNDVKIELVSTEDNIADLLTKALSQLKHDGHIESLDIRYMVIGSSTSRRLLVYTLDPIELDAM